MPGQARSAGYQRKSFRMPASPRRRRPQPRRQSANSQKRCGYPEQPNQDVPSQRSTSSTRTATGCRNTRSWCSKWRVSEPRGSGLERRNSCAVASAAAKNRLPASTTPKIMVATERMSLICETEVAAAPEAAVCSLNRTTPIIIVANAAVRTGTRPAKVRNQKCEVVILKAFSRPLALFQRSRRAPSISINAVNAHQGEIQPLLLPRIIAQHNPTV